MPLGQSLFIKQAVKTSLKAMGVDREVAKEVSDAIGLISAVATLDHLTICIEAIASARDDGELELAVDEFFDALLEAVKDEIKENILEELEEFFDTFNSEVLQGRALEKLQQSLEDLLYKIVRQGSSFISRRL